MIRHPEFELARWAATHLTADERRDATVYTSGEHCPMCAAAHAWVGLGRIVYAMSTTQLTALRAGTPPAPVRPLAIGDIAPGIPVNGPADELLATVTALHHRSRTHDVDSRKLGGGKNQNHTPHGVVPASTVKSKGKTGSAFRIEGETYDEDGNKYSYFLRCRLA